MEKQTYINEYEEILAQWKSFINYLHTSHKLYKKTPNEILILGELLPINMEIGSPDDAVEWQTYDLEEERFVNYHIAKGFFGKDGFPSEEMYQITDFIDLCDTKTIELLEELDMNVVDSIDMYAERNKEIDEEIKRRDEEFKRMKEKWEYEEEQGFKELCKKQHQFFEGLEPDVRNDNTFWASVKW